MSQMDPAVLKLEVEETVGLRQQKLLEADESGARSERGIQAHARWRATRAALRATAGTASVRVESATAWAAGEAVGKANSAIIVRPTSLPRSDRWNPS